MTEPEEDTLRVPARVIGCVTPGCIDVFVGPDVGMLDGGIPAPVPLDIVPLSLRMPNTEFMVIVDRRSHTIVAVEPLG